MSPIYWGMLQSGAPGILAQLETNAGKRGAVAVFGTSWHGGAAYPGGAYNTAGVGSTIRTTLDAINARGQIPCMDWYSDIGGDVAFSLKAIYSQKLHEAFLIQFAQDIASLPYSIFIRFNGEMNGSWRPSYYERNGFGTAPNTNAAGDFVLMWRYVVDLFRAQGARNVTWLWCPNYQPTAPVVTLASIYPGRRADGSPYTDWIGLDAYNWGGSAPGGTKTQPWFTFRQTLRSGGSAASWISDSWAELTALDPDLPCFLGEFGCDTREGTDTNASAATAAVWNGAKKATWFEDAFNVQIPGAEFGPRLKLVLYFNDTDAGQVPPLAGGFAAGDGDWPIEDPTAASGKAGGGLPQAAFQGPLGPGSSAYYLAGGKFLLPTGKIKPYEATLQTSRYVNAVLNASPAHLTLYTKLNEVAGTVATDASGNARHGTYAGGFTLARPKIVPGTLDLAVLSGGTGYVTFADNDAYSLSTTGKLTIAVAFMFPALPANGVTAALVAKAASGAFEWEVRVVGVASGSATVELVAWKLDGSTYLSAVNAVAIAANTPYLVVATMDQSRAPVGRLGYGAIGAAAMTFVNSVDTLANAPANGTGTLDIGRRGVPDHLANAYFSHVAMWNVALTDLSANELLKAAALRRDKPFVLAA